MGTGAKGTQGNPYTMTEFEELADAGLWHGGYVIDDGGTVSYFMAELTVIGYSGYSGYGSSGSGSDGSWDPWGSDGEGSNPWDDDGDDDDDDNYGSHGHSTNSNPTGEPSGEGGGHSNSNGEQTEGDSINNGQCGTFLQGAPYYTEKEFDQMYKNGTWVGGNVYTLGYIGTVYDINQCLSSVDAYDSWLDELGNLAAQVCSEINKINNKIMSSPYVQAIGRYNSGTGTPLTLNVNSLGLDNLRFVHLHLVNGTDNKYSVNLLNPDMLQILLQNRSTEEQLNTLSTALTLGNITLTRIYGNYYSIEDDVYDFEMHTWDDSLGRNLATIIGHCFSEGLSVVIDYAAGCGLGKVLGRDFDIALGLVRRHVLGTTKFTIHFTGLIIIE